MWDWNRIFEIWFCLLLVAVFAGIIGWFLRELFCKKKFAEYEGRLRENEDEISRLRASIGKVKGDASSENTKDDAAIASLNAKIKSLEEDLRISHDRQYTIESELKGWESKAATLSSASAGAVVGAAVASSGGDSDKDAEITRLKADLANLTAKLRVSRSDDAADESEIKKLRADLSGLQTKLSDAENERVYLLGQVKKAEAGESIKRDVPMDQRDDLELIHGVGPVLERMLYDLGVYFFKDIAAWDAAKIAEMNEKLPNFRGRIERENWVESAKEEHFKKYGERI